jgi:Flp pilus assembly protein TadG
VPNRVAPERGSAAVEFALLLPILLLLLLALVQVGVIARDTLILAQASRAGAREAAVQPSGEEVEEAVRAAAVGLDARNIKVAVAWGETEGSAVTVTVGYDVPTASLLAGWLFPGSIELTSVATMRREFA